MRDVLAVQDQSSQEDMAGKSLFINSFTHTDADFMLLTHCHSVSMILPTLHHLINEDAMTRSFDTTMITKAKEAIKKDFQ